MHAALLNVSINLASIEDQAYLGEVQRKMDAITGGRQQTRDRVLEIVHRKIGA